ncbi:hypothetical protein FA95DRAFT_615139 [Auriscalpium vulgare]|uniref:Uncharacterized protein n=1 Tax=Auriscalpium vulgare TaxID=40419 RepID=A0ACB8RDN2_9AGAM|nr:hypothetical protein FA95DRAFT_615139 [Auriscalpium vulgare]
MYVRHNDYGPGCVSAASRTEYRLVGRRCSVRSAFPVVVLTPGLLVAAVWVVDLGARIVARDATREGSVDVLHDGEDCSRWRRRARTRTTR